MAPESDDGDGGPARAIGAAVRPSGALTQVPSTAPNPQIQWHRHKYTDHISRANNSRVQLGELCCRLEARPLGSAS